MRVIARTPRGLEAAEVLSEATDEQAKLLESSPGGQIMREMSAEDSNELAHLQDRELAAFETCRNHVARLNLPMQLGIESINDRLNILDPWGNRIEIVPYDDVQFTKADHIVKGMGIEPLRKSANAIEELKKKGMAPTR
jgi:hypothetical protein